MQDERGVPYHYGRGEEVSIIAHEWAMGRLGPRQRRLACNIDEREIVCEEVNDAMVVGSVKS